MVTILQKIIQKVFNAPDFESALKLLAKEVKSSMHTDVCSIYLFDKEVNRFVLRATEGLRKSAIGKVSLSSEEGLVGWVATRGEPVNLHDASSHPRFQFIVGIGEERYSAFLGVPLIHQKKVLGVLVVQQKAARTFDSEEEAFLVTLSAQLAAVVVHADANDALVLKEAGARKRLKEARFTGIAGASGVAIAQAVVVYPKAELKAVPEKFIEQEQVEAELQVFFGALDQVRADIIALQKKVAAVLPVAEQALFDVYLNILDRNALGGEIADVIKAGQWAQGAVKKVVKKHVRAFEEMDDPYMSERAVDVRDLGIRLLSVLQEHGSQKTAYFPDTILVGEEVTTSQLLEVPVEKLRGVVSVSGSSSSHMAIVARALNVPAVVGAVDFPFEQVDGRDLIVDGFQGLVYCDPGKELKKHYHRVITEEKNILVDLEKYRDLKADTTDGHNITLWVNTGLTVDVLRSMDQGAEGVGLYRTEIPFMIRERFPSEREQIAIYKEQLLAANPKVFTMRTLDIGGDKALSYFPIEEENPFLGWRGIRVMLDHPELFMAQVRAMLIASEGLSNLRILIPMITNVFEVDDALKFIQRAYAEVCEEGYRVTMPPVGVMIEVPAAVYQARALAERVDFISVGSNDLTQYLLAVDRNNPSVASLYNAFHPAVLHALQDIVTEVKKAGKTVSICGEMAGDPRAAILLMAMGFDSLSMSASQLLKVKYTIRNSSFEECRRLLAACLAFDNSAATIKHLSGFFEHKKLSYLVRG